MAHIYNSLKNVLQELKSEHKIHPSFVFLILMSITIPLGYAVNNIALALFVLSALIFFKRDNVKINTALSLPVLLFALMGMSYFWSIEPSRTLKAIPKEISLLLVPIAFVAFKDFTARQKDKILKYYSWSIFAYTIFCFLKAIARFVISRDYNVFFYHELVTKEVNAIHVSVFVSVAFFWFLTKPVRNLADKLALLVLFMMVFLLASKNIIAVFIVLLFVYYFFYTEISKKMRLRNLTFFILIIIPFFFIGKIKQRFEAEFQSNNGKSMSSDVVQVDSPDVNVLSINEALTNKTFSPNDYFPGTAFRAYQFRIFVELMQENKYAFWRGFGLNASLPKVEEKAMHYNLFMGNNDHEGYQQKNFHNQYVQNFAELGVFGFIILLGMLFINTKNAFLIKDFVQIAFAILMISLFLTESFLWRQRGVLFFTIFYCLFNTTNTLKAKKINS